MPNSARVIKGQPDNTYIVVRNLHSAALTHGDCVVWLTTADTPPTGYTWIPGVDVKGGSAAASNLVAGIMRVPANLTNGLAQGDYGVCQVGGFHPAVKTTAAAVAGANASILIADNSAKVVVGAVGDDPNGRIGVCIKTGANNVAGCLLRCQ